MFALVGAALWFWLRPAQVSVAEVYMREIGPELERLVRLIDQPVRLEVMVTLTCPYCPKMAQVAHQLAFANDFIRAEIVNSAEFPQLVKRYDVHGVPKTVINGRPAFEGALPAAQAILEILKLVKPREYEELEAAREIHVINILPDFQADPALQEEVRKSPQGTRSFNKVPALK
jgi:alkyl hydroperoxide reductase subunit AhpF